MSGGPVFPLPISGSPEPDLAESSDWLAPATVAYTEQYMTPFPTASIDSQTWNAYKPVMQDASYAPPTLGTSFSVPQYYMANSLSRPRSSPSTFGPGPDLHWPVSSGLGIQYNEPILAPTPIPSNMYAPLGSSARNTPELQAPQPRRPYQTIAPNPAGIAAVKRVRDDDDVDSDSGLGKRRRRTASIASVDLSEDDRYLVQLKEDESLPWKEIATRFSTDKGKSFQVPALQMRYKRLREKYRIWDEQDVNALRSAHEYWNKYKWEIISQKMTEFGSPDRWPARSCARKWQEIEQSTMTTITAGPSGMTPAMSQYTTSPVDAPVHFAFLPMQ